MKAQELDKIVSWFKETDLSEVSYRERSDGFTLAKAEPAAEAPVSNFPNRYVAVTAPAIGLFYWSEPGRARSVEEGSNIQQGQALGYVELAKNRREAVSAAVGGRLARIMVEEGEAVEFGRPLFFIEAAH
jgi:biotin carboxyl carrier protein